MCCAQAGNTRFRFTARIDRGTTRSSCQAQNFMCTLLSAPPLTLLTNCLKLAIPLIEYLILIAFKLVLQRYVTYNAVQPGVAVLFDVSILPCRYTILKHLPSRILSRSQLVSSQIPERSRSGLITVFKSARIWILPMHSKLPCPKDPT